MDFLNENQEIIDINTTYGLLLNENDIAKTVHSTEKDEKVAKLIASDSQSKVNKLLRPKGVIITDTVNHLMYPIPHPRIDTSKFDLPDVQRHFQEYTGTKMDFLPWHFTVDFIKSKYYIFNTRPIDMKFPLPTKEWAKHIEQSDMKLNKRTHKFFETRPFEIDQAIHVAIIGDSTKDIYVKKLYELMGRNCIGPVLRHFKLAAKMWQKVYALNMGTKFSTTSLDSYLTR